jgi:hypothetical protein
MNLRTVFSTVVILSAAWAGPSMAQQTLGDLVASGGYDWIIGRWVATTDEGQKVEFTFDWALDKHVVLNSLQMGDFQYQGIVRLARTGDEAVDEGVDSRGGTWKGAWSPDGDGLVRRVEHMSADGQTRQGDIVFAKVDNDTVTIAIYAVDNSGSRSAEPWSKLTYKRQQGKAAPVSAAAETANRATDYQKLGDIVSEGGYEWMTGKWKATGGDQTYELEFKPILNMHAALADVTVGDAKYLVMITYVASRQEVVDFGVDNSGGMWKGTWEQEGSDAVNKIEYTQPDGKSWKMQHVYVKINNDEMKVKQYEVGTDGSHAAEPRRDLTFKRQKPAAPQTKETK